MHREITGLPMTDDSTRLRREAESRPVQRLYISGESVSHHFLDEPSLWLQNEDDACTTEKYWDVSIALLSHFNVRYTPDLRALKVRAMT